MAIEGPWRFPNDWRSGFAFSRIKIGAIAFVLIFFFADLVKPAAKKYNLIEIGTNHPCFDPKEGEDFQGPSWPSSNHRRPLPPSSLPLFSPLVLTLPCSLFGDLGSPLTASNGLLGLFLSFPFPFSLFLSFLSPPLLAGVLFQIA